MQVMLDADSGTLSSTLMRASLPLRVTAPPRDGVVILTVLFELIRTGLLVVGTVPKLQLVAVDHSPPDAPVKVFVVWAWPTIGAAKKSRKGHVFMAPDLRAPAF
ncbi:MAG: hypothetical protein EBS54_08580 [Betaproteobacteria bacterium]|nr:hypothetical protein [Betaproteobacteria bacterium]